METKELLHCCRAGDLNRLEYLVDHKEVDLNIRDTWDSTPLYYACLCGHEELVRYLLEKGAKCEVNTFDGERCLYGALTNEIRNLLRSYNAVTTSTIRRDQYHEFLRRLQESGLHADVTFQVHGENVVAHRCVLSARCRYFMDMFKTKWKDREKITINHSLCGNRLYTSESDVYIRQILAYEDGPRTERVHSWAFKKLMLYIYTDRLECPIDQVECVVQLARQCRLYALLENLEEKIKHVLSMEATKPGVHVTVVCLEPDPHSTQLQSDLSILADCALPLGFRNEAQIELPFPVEDIYTFADVIFSVDGHDFQCHKSFFCMQSDYFKALIKDHFGETHINEQNCLPVVTVSGVSAAVFMKIMYYIYQDSCELKEHDVYEVLSAADLYMLPRLKRHCAGVICRYLAPDNVVSILRLARLFNLARLEDQCAEVMSMYIDKLVEQTEFIDLVREDAASVQGRQETDSIPVVDDIRFHITNFMQTFSDMYDAEQKLGALHSLLDRLGLDA